MQMLFGYVLSGETRLNVAFFFVGRGGDGKSTAAHVLRAMVGEENCSALGFGDLGARFSSKELTDYTLNIAEEMAVGNDHTSISECEKVLKMLTDGAVIAIEEKHKTPDRARVTARCVFCTNQLPQFTDRTNGLWDRVVVIPFNNRFRGTENEKSDLKHELEAELPGIVIWAIDGARMLKDQKGFPRPKASMEYLKSHRADCDHEATFLNETVHEDSAGVLQKIYLYQAYRNWCEDSGYKPLASHRFNSAVINKFPDVKEKRERRAGRDIYVWIGIAWGAPEEPETEASCATVSVETPPADGNAAEDACNAPECVTAHSCESDVKPVASVAPVAQKIRKSINDIQLPDLSREVEKMKEKLKTMEAESSMNQMDIF